MWRNARTMICVYQVSTRQPGSYLCTCPRGSSGNATVLDGCHKKDKFTVPLKAVTGMYKKMIVVVIQSY
jgi:CDGSH-type Zn-finger protein